MEDQGSWEFVRLLLFWWKLRPEITILELRTALTVLSKKQQTREAVNAQKSAQQMTQTC